MNLCQRPFVMFFRIAGRRMSLAAGSNVDLQREKMEGALLTVCMECKDVVLQVRGMTCCTVSSYQIAYFMHI
jgi:hypothetical protein